jgi:hypothetical protein
MALLCHDPAITEDHQILFFTTSLGQPLRIDAALQKLATLDAIIMYARAYVQHDKTMMPQPAQPMGHTFQ